ncbi:MAG: sn-glycerol-3-phosphate ABC transporter ATP-binding protein UgpC [Candidatus Auribacterota bacterium]|jgi:multiple sugar transport system ATP-binding protein|uniref:sn-glycerol-3-phosphate ABC transporter ATP-binding protein UgpC n=1 Tax=Candidatus Auribacter fodinae TaxID=2093366 RepID=A0A3A4RJU8_9BACT|nr:MAG: sn-glycerol-3-phosphate ABC transporter ATP-binding protein UgpC [Candidatus Auribacter fodinae]
MSSVVLEKVTKFYPESKKPVVDSIDLTIESQELLILVGPSGCGKTTTLRMIAGLEDITYGTIYIDNTKINNLSPRERNVAMVFQNYALYPHMTVYENLAFSLSLHKVPKDEIKTLVTETAALLAISDILDTKPYKLSGGQQQRVALGRAIVRSPKIFLFDEPLSNLDAHLRSQMRTELSRLHTRLATTMIYVTHDQLEAMSMGEKIVVMNKGKIQQTGDPLTIYNRPANKFVAGFFGNPPINFFSGTIVSQDGTLFFASKNVLFPIAEEKSYTLSHYCDKEIYMGLRPEQVSNKQRQSGLQPFFHLRSSVEVIEQLGPEMLVYLSHDQHDFVARLDAWSEYKVGDQIDIYLNLEKSLFFDFQTENLVI